LSDLQITRLGEDKKLKRPITPDNKAHFSLILWGNHAKWASARYIKWKSQDDL